MLNVVIYLYIFVVRLSYAVYVITRGPQTLPIDLACSPSYSFHFISPVYMYNVKLMGITPPMQRLSKKSKHIIEYKHGKHK